MRDRDTGKWIPAVKYATGPEFKALAKEHGEFSGYDINGQACFTSKEGMVTRIGEPVENAMELMAQTPGRAVGIWPKHSDPQLVIVDCDHDVYTVEPDEKKSEIEFGDVYKTVYGIRQLQALYARNDEPWPPQAPTIDGGHDKHGYSVFSRIRRGKIARRLIKPHHLALDIIGAGYQVHWSASPKRLVSGRELLDEPPELPLFVAKYVTARRTVEMRKPPQGNLRWLLRHRQSRS